MSLNSIRDQLNRYTPAQLASISQALSGIAGLPLGITADGQIAVKMQVVQGTISTLTPGQILVNAILALGGVDRFWIADTDSYVSNGGAVATNGDPVGQWPDQSANGDNANQVTALARPTLITNSVNGRSSLLFNGLNNSFSFGGFDISGKAITAVLQCPVDSMLLGGNTANRQVRVNDPLMNYLSMYNGTNPYSGVMTNLSLWSILTYVTSTPDSDFSQNGVQKIAGGNTPFSGAFVVDAIGQFLGGLLPFSGNIACIIIYDMSNQAAVISLLRTHYSL